MPTTEERLAFVRTLRDEELEKELARRKAAKAAPEPLATPDFSVVSEMVLRAVSELADPKDPDRLEWEHDDFEHYVFEAAVEAVYGRAIWDFVRAKTR